MANNQQDNNLQNSSEIKNQNTDVNTDVYIQGNASGGNVAGRDIHITHIHNALQDSHLKIDTQYVTSPHKMAKETIERINNYFYGYFKLFRILNEFPKLISRGVYKPDDFIKNAATKYRLHLKKNKRPNDPHALLISDTVYNDTPLKLLYNATDYATICALRENEGKPKVISANVLAINEESRKLILHRRSGESAKYANALHTIGGGFEPSGIAVKDDDDSLELTMIREFHEEMKINFILPEHTNLLFGEETNTGFIQIVALGVKVNSHDIKKINPNFNWEGKEVFVDFDDLYEKLRDDNEIWVHSGKAHILVWLALGAPNCHPNTKFSGYSAKELFDKIIGKLELNL